MAEENLQVEKTSEQIFDFVEQLRALQTSDKGHPDTFNPLFQNLIQNDLYLRQKVELLQGLIDELERDIADTINIDLTTLKQHLDNRSNPHNVTADQLGLGSISNYSIATTPEAQQGVVNTKYMTPLRTKEAIQYMAPSKADFTGHIENRNNPHGVTVGQIGAIPTSHSSYRNWIWSGQPGQPQWMWGGNTPNDIYVYNPSNFNVRRSVFTDLISTQNAVGGSHGEGLPLYCRHNVFGDGRFGVKVDGHETRVDYATNSEGVRGRDICTEIDNLRGVVELGAVKGVQRGYIKTVTVKDTGEDGHALDVPIVAVNLTKTMINIYTSPRDTHESVSGRLLNANTLRLYAKAYSVSLCWEVIEFY